MCALYLLRRQNTHLSAQRFNQCHCQEQPEPLMPVAAFTAAVPGLAKSGKNRCRKAWPVIFYLYLYRLFCPADGKLYSGNKNNMVKDLLILDDDNALRRTLSALIGSSGGSGKLPSRCSKACSIASGLAGFGR